MNKFQKHLKIWIAIIVYFPTTKMNLVLFLFSVPLAKFNFNPETEIYKKLKCHVFAKFCTF